LSRTVSAFWPVLKVIGFSCTYPAATILAAKYFYNQNFWKLSGLLHQHVPDQLPPRQKHSGAIFVSAHPIRTLQSSRHFPASNLAIHYTY